MFSVKCVSCRRSCEQTNPFMLEFLPAVNPKTKLPATLSLPEKPAPRAEDPAANSHLWLAATWTSFFCKAPQTSPQLLLFFSEFKADGKQVKGQLSEQLLRFNTSLTQLKYTVFTFVLRLPSVYWFAMVGNFPLFFQQQLGNHSAFGQLLDNIPSKH